LIVAEGMWMGELAYRVKHFETVLKQDKKINQLPEFTFSLNYMLDVT